MRKRLTIWLPGVLLAGVMLAGVLLAGAACPKRDDATPIDVVEPATKTNAPLDATAPDARTGNDVSDAPAPIALAPTFSTGPGARAVVVYVSSVEGYVEPCGCTGDPLGGIARLAAVFADARAAYGERVFFVDGGDLLFEREGDNLAADECQTGARHGLLVDTYAQLGLVGTVLGPRDDVRGAKWRDAFMAKHAIPTFEARANVGRAMLEGAKRIRGRVVERGGVKIGFTGATVSSSDDVKAVHQALTTEAARLRGDGAAAVVVVLQAERAVTEAVARALPVDVVIQGRRPGEVPVSPVRAGDNGPIIVASGQQAQYAGVLEFALDGRSGDAPLPLDDREGEASRRARLLDARIAQYQKGVDDAEGARKSFIEQKLSSAVAERARVFVDAQRAPPPPVPYVTARAVALTRGRAEEPSAKRALDAYRDAVPSLVARCEENIECPPLPPGAASFVGVESCFECHKDAVTFWRNAVVSLAGKDADGRPITREVGHGKAWKTLTVVGKDKDRECVGCHSVGFNLPGGYCKVSEVDFRRDVQCESCHGPGSLHVASAGDPKLISRSVDEATCRGCHHVPHIPTTESFVMDERLLHVLGDGHGKARHDALSRAKGEAAPRPKENP